MIFSGLTSKSMVTVFSSLTSKSVTTVSPDLASKPVVQVYRFGPQNRRLRFGDLCLKITVTVSWFGTQNEAGFDLSVAPQNRQREVGVGHASRSIGLLRVEVSRARVSQFASKLAEARQHVVHVVSSRRLGRDEAEDG
jgi:hypothetical protein